MIPSLLIISPLNPTHELDGSNFYSWLQAISYIVSMNSHDSKLVHYFDDQISLYAPPSATCPNNKISSCIHA